MGPQFLLSRIPNTAILSYTSNIRQHDVSIYSGLNIRFAAWAPNLGPDRYPSLPCFSGARSMGPCFIYGTYGHAILRALMTSYWELQGSYGYDLQTHLLNTRSSYERRLYVSSWTDDIAVYMVVARNKNRAADHQLRCAGAVSLPQQIRHVGRCFRAVLAFWVGARDASGSQV